MLRPYGSLSDREKYLMCVTHSHVATPEEAEEFRRLFRAEALEHLRMNVISEKRATSASRLDAARSMRRSAWVARRLGLFDLAVQYEDLVNAHLEGSKGCRTWQPVKYQHETDVCCRLRADAAELERVETSWPVLEVPHDPAALDFIPAF